MPNLSLIEMLRRQFEIALPPLPELQEADAYESVEDYWAKCRGIDFHATRLEDSQIRFGISFPVPKTPDVSRSGCCEVADR